MEGKNQPKNNWKHFQRGLLSAVDSILLLVTLDQILLDRTTPIQDMALGESTAKIMVKSLTANSGISLPCHPKSL